MDKVLAALSFSLCFWSVVPDTKFKDCDSAGGLSGHKYVPVVKAVRVFHRVNSSIAADASKNESFSIHDMGSSGEVLRLKVLDCTDPPCYFEQMTNVTALLHFRTSEKDDIVDSMTSSFVAVLTPELEVPFPYKRTDVCSRLQNAPEGESNDTAAKECPVSPGSEVVYYTVLPLEDEYPMIRATIRWSITDQNNKTLACVEVPCQLL